MQTLATPSRRHQSVQGNPLVTAAVALPVREQMVAALEKVSIQILRQTEKGYFSALSENEKISQRAVNALPWVAGNWFRPIHNHIVPLAMAVLCKHLNLPRELMHVAMWHDVGYTSFEVGGSQYGTGWKEGDMRELHMKEGARLFKEFVAGPGKDLLSHDLAQQYTDFIAVHDNAYTAGPTKDMSTALRDADRVFVPSLISYMKDFISYVAEAAKKGERYTVEDHFVRRLQDFYSCADEIPLRIRKNHPLLVERFHGAKISKKCIPQTTRPGKQMIDMLLLARSQELPLWSQCGAMRDFKRILFKRGVQEFHVLTSMGR